MITNPEFSFFVNCLTLKEAEKTFEIEANTAERAALAKRLNLLRLDSLTVKAVVARKSSDLVHTQCDCCAILTQECVVTAKPLESSIKFSFERTYSASAKEYFGNENEPDGEGEPAGSGIDDETPEPPDPMTDGGFDIGESVAEQLSLEIDPFPRAAGASFEDVSSAKEDEEGAGRVSPFAVLEQLKKKL